MIRYTKIWEHGLLAMPTLQWSTLLHITHLWDFN